MGSDLPNLIEALSNPKFYREETKSVRCAHTPTSCVFLTDKYAYKLKKPVNLGFLDYSSLEQRYFYCQQEVLLNRRLCPEVYLGVEPIFRSGSKYSFGAEGTIADYVVKMLRLPETGFLDYMLNQETISKSLIDAIAKKVSGFHQKAQSNDLISGYGSTAHIRKNITENFIQTEKYVGHVVPLAQYQTIQDFSLGFIENNDELFIKRMTNQYIRDCHGDLHAQHICFGDDVYIVDCIEFNDRFRFCDTASESAFLTMDLEHNGQAMLGDHFFRQYTSYCQDIDAYDLLRFYKCYRACVRAKVACFKSVDSMVGETEKEKAHYAAQQYFDLALTYSLGKPIVIVMLGLTGSGKTTFATALSKHIGASYISSDITRKQLAGVPKNVHCYGQTNTGIYSPDYNRKTYNSVLSQATEALEKEIPAVLDAAFLRHSERQQAKAMAEKHGAKLLFVECRLDRKLTKDRLEHRMSQESVSDGTWEIYQMQEQWYEPIEEISTHSITIDTAMSVAHNIRQVMERITKL